MGISLEMSFVTTIIQWILTDVQIRVKLTQASIVQDNLRLAITIVETIFDIQRSNVTMATPTTMMDVPQHVKLSMVTHAIPLFLMFVQRFVEMV